MKVFKGKLDKKIVVELVDEAEESFKKLSQIVGEQKKKGVESSPEIKLLNSIKNMSEILKEKPFYGENAKKKLIPLHYKNKYGVSNLFIVDLPDYWRLIYTLESDEVEIVSFILDIFDHNKYNKIFGFKKR